MKNLFIIRHAKAKSSKQGQEDYDRELNKEGKLRASISGKWINSLSEKIDLICCSSSSRTQQTTKIIANEMKYNPKIIVEPNLYSSDEYDLFHYIKSLDNKKSTNTKSLFSDYISKEEIFACTSCNACVEACPININPLEIILELRRFSALEESSSPSEWNAMFQNIETNYSPWKFPIDDRFNWSKE